MSEITVENTPTPSIAALLLAGVLVLPPFPPSLLPEHGSTCCAGVELENRSAVVGPLPTQLDYALESPDFIPQQLREFAARGFERRNRWS
jgi:hypothetical protein